MPMSLEKLLELIPSDTEQEVRRVACGIGECREIRLVGRLAAAGQ